MRNPPLDWSLRALYVQSSDASRVGRTTPRHNQYRTPCCLGPTIDRPTYQGLVLSLFPTARRSSGRARLSGVVSVDIAELKQKSVAELHSLAEQLNITNYSGLRKQDLIFRIEQSLLDSDTVIRGEGVLEILPEGYGFLRSQDWNYLYGPDDIYVSPSQIKRFDLRTGDTVMGQVRPPKEGERYLALLKVESVNFEQQEKTQHRVAFENLRPRYPEERVRLERSDGDLSMRVMDLLSPIGKGQRALIVSPPKAGKTILLQKLANSIIENHAEIYLIVLLID